MICRTVAGWVLGLSLGGSVRAQDLHLSLFNRSGLKLRLVPKAMPQTRACNKFLVRVHDLPKLRTDLQVLNFRTQALPSVDLEPDGLLMVSPLRGGGLRGGVAFEVLVAGQDAQAWQRVGEVTCCVGTLGGTPLACLSHTLEAPFRMDGALETPWKGVLRVHDPLQEAWEQLLDAEVAEAKAADAVRLAVCTIL